MDFSSNQIVFIIELLIFIALFVPTMVAFITGAPWVPTPIARVKKMLELAQLKKGDRVYDLGCGDGRMVHLAARDYGADAIGLELSPLVYSWARIRNFFLRSKSQVLLRDFRRVHYGNAKALVMYLLPGILKTMRSKWETELQPGTRIVSYAFEIPGWTPVYIEPKDPAKNFARIMVYEVPHSLEAHHASENSKNAKGTPANA